MQLSTATALQQLMHISPSNPSIIVALAVCILCNLWFGSHRDETVTAAIAAIKQVCFFSTMLSLYHR
jgi:hypothetical protein